MFCITHELCLLSIKQFNTEVIPKLFTLDNLTINKYFSISNETFLISVIFKVRLYFSVRKFKKADNVFFNKESIKYFEGIASKLIPAISNIHDFNSLNEI